MTSEIDPTKVRLITAWVITHGSTAQIATAKLPSMIWHYTEHGFDVTVQIWPTLVMGIRQYRLRGVDWTVSYETYHTAIKFSGIKLPMVNIAVDDIEAYLRDAALLTLFM